MAQKNKKLRLDQLLVLRKLAPSRERAQAIILAGQALVDDRAVDKPGRMFPESVTLAVRKDPNPYVSRGGLKLARALEVFNIALKGKRAVDIGASSGGFSDCLLKHGVNKVIAVDVGYGQLNWKLQKDPRMTIVDRANARYITLEKLSCAPLDIAVIDVSFISLHLIIPPAIGLLKEEGDLIALVKPQFEVGKDEVENKGIIKDPAKHLKVLLKLTAFVKRLEWVVTGAVPSPITGQKGNREFLVHCLHNTRGPGLDDGFIQDMVNQSNSEERPR